MVRRDGGCDDGRRERLCRRLWLRLAEVEVGRARLRLGRLRLWTYLGRPRLRTGLGRYVRSRVEDHINPAISSPVLLGLRVWHRGKPVPNTTVDPADLRGDCVVIDEVNQQLSGRPMLGGR